MKNAEGKRPGEPSRGRWAACMRHSTFGILHSVGTDMNLQAFSLEGRVALVTGASRGLGAAMAMGLAEAGADIVLHDRADSCDSERAIRERTGVRTCCLRAD